MSISFCLSDWWWSLSSKMFPKTTNAACHLQWRFYSVYIAKKEIYLHDFTFLTIVVAKHHWGVGGFQQRPEHRSTTGRSAVHFRKPVLWGSLDNDFFILFCWLATNVISVVKVICVEEIMTSSTGVIKLMNIIGFNITAARVTFLFTFSLQQCSWRHFQFCW